jgi:hypothetical protein
MHGLRQTNGGAEREHLPTLPRPHSPGGHRRAGWRERAGRSRVDAPWRRADQEIACRSQFSLLGANFSRSAIVQIPKCVRTNAARQLGAEFVGANFGALFLKSLGRQLGLSGELPFRAQSGGLVPAQNRK